MKWKGWKVVKKDIAKYSGTQYNIIMSYKKEEASHKMSELLYIP